MDIPSIIFLFLFIISLIGCAYTAHRYIQLIEAMRGFLLEIGEKVEQMEKQISELKK